MENKSPVEKVVFFLEHVKPEEQKHRDAVFRALQFLADRGVIDRQNRKQFLSNVARDSRSFGTLTGRQAVVVAKQLIRYSEQLVDFCRPEKVAGAPGPVVVEGPVGTVCNGALICGPRPEPVKAARGTGRLEGPAPIPLQHVPSESSEPKEWPDWIKNLGEKK